MLPQPAPYLTLYFLMRSEGQAAGKLRSTMVFSYDEAKRLVETTEFRNFAIRADGSRQEVDPEKEKRFLLAVVNHAPDKDAIARDVFECREKLEALALYFWESVVVPFRAAAGHTPPASLHPSRGEEPSTESEEEMEHLTLTESATRQQRKIRREVGDRDGYRCLVTGLSENEHETVMAHIVPFSANDKSPFLQALSRFSPQLKLGSRVNGENINKAYNILTLSNGVAHERFSDWTFVINPEETANGFNFRIEVLNTWKSNRLLRRYNEDGTSQGIDQLLIMPTKSQPENRAVDPGLLAVHAALGRVLHSSGRAEELQHLLNEEPPGTRTLTPFFEAVSAKLRYLGAAHPAEAASSEQ